MKKNHDSDWLASTASALSTESRINVLLEEYRALYGLLTIRLDVLDRRIPAVGGTLAAILASATAMPDETRIAFLLGIPAAFIGLVQSVCQHARSKEDHLRRIDEIERLVNHLAGEVLLVFQSQHPNRHRQPGGRSGFGTVLHIFAAVLIMLGACGVVAWRTDLLCESRYLLGYVGYLGISAMLAVAPVVRLRGYRYERPPPAECPVFASHGFRRT